MGFLSKLKDFFFGEENYDGMSEEYIEQFQNSATGRLTLIESQLYLIEGTYPEGAREIKEKLNQIRQLKNQDKYELEAEVSELEKLYKQNKHISDEKGCINAIDNVVHEVEKLRKEAGHINIDELQEKEEYVESVLDKVQDFDGENRDLLIASLMKARYNITMLKIELAGEQSDIEEYMQDIDRMSKVEKVYWASLLFSDINSMLVECDLFSKEYKKLVRENNGNKDDGIEDAIESLSQNLETLKNYFEQDYIQDFEPYGLFQNEEFLTLFAETRNKLNKNSELIEEYNKKIESEMQRKKQKEQYTNMTEDEIESQLRKIDENVFDIKDKYKQIMQFQIGLAKEKGLVTKRNVMQDEGIGFKPYETFRAISRVKDSMQNNIYFKVLLGVDDDINTSVLVMSKNDIRNINAYVDLDGIHDYNGNYTLECISGKMYNGVIEMIPKSYRGRFFKKPYNEDDRFFNSLYTYYYDNEIGKTTRDIMTDVYKEIKKMDSPDFMSQFPFYIEIPLARSMMSIIEQLNEQNIQFYIPPVEIEGFDQKRSKPFYRIYIDREYLQQYKEKVHPNISSLEKGVVTIGAENVSISKLFLKGTEFPFELDKEKDKEKEK